MADNTISYIALGVSLLSVAFVGTQTYFRYKEYKRDKRKIEVFFTLSDRHDVSAILHLTNLSSIPVIVRSWELAWRSRFLFFWTKYHSTDLKSPHDLYLTLPSRNTTAINFNNQETFIWLGGERKTDVLYLRLNVAGEKSPMYKRVYTPNKFKLLEFLGIKKTKTL
jgi:hypothetical protein